MVTRSDVVPLTDAIAALRREIGAAAEQAVKLPAEERFRITGVELELTVAAEDVTTGGGEIGWWIFKAKADVSAKDVVTHKVKLTLDVGEIAVGSKAKSR